MKLSLDGYILIENPNDFDNLITRSRFFRSLFPLAWGPTFDIVLTYT